MRHLFNRADDIQAHTLAIEQWKQDYYQITPGKIQCSLNYLQLENIHVFKESFNQSTAQYGSVPQGLLGIALVTSSKPVDASTVQGAPFKCGSLYLVGPGKEFITHTAEGVETIVFALPLCYLEKTCEHAFPEILDRNRLSDSLSINELHNLENFISTTDALYEMAAQESAQEKPIKEIESFLIESILCTLTNGIYKSDYLLSERVRCDIVRRSKELLTEMEALNILDLCLKLRVSRRTLQLAFNYVTGQSPLSYLRSVKLGHVRNQIIHEPKLSIGDIAYNNGFFHLGRFSNDYKQLFGELPSETRRPLLGSLSGTSGCFRRMKPSVAVPEQQYH